MDSATERLTLTFPGSDVSAGFVESATITHNGHAYTNQGAYVSPTHLIAYLSGDKAGRQLFKYRSMGGTDMYEPATGIVTTWQGERIGRYDVTGTAWGFNGTRLYTVRIVLDSGEVFNGKGQGTGMLIKARRSPLQYVALDSPTARRRMPWRYDA